MHLSSYCNSLLLCALQQAGGKTLDAPAVEITYGMERILMALQVRHSRQWVGRGFAKGACWMYVSPTSLAPVALSAQSSDSFAGL